MSDGRSFLLKAEKLEASASGGFSFFGSNKQDKLEQAADEYVKAANAFRTTNQGAEAGSAFEKAASIAFRINEPNDGANYLTEAFKSYKRTNPQDAARVLDQAINHYALTNVRRAATNKQTLAELYEIDLGDYPRAIAEYERAGEWFLNDNAEALANKCFLKVGDLAAILEDYHKATSRYEQVANASINNNLMRWSVKEYFFKAGICHLASKDIIATKRALDQYQAVDNSFSQQREFFLLVDLLNAVEANDPETFSEKLFQFDQMSKLDKWKTTLLLRVKQGIEEAGDDLT